MINPTYKDKMYVVPWDSGAFCGGYGPPGSTPKGGFDSFYHLMQPHIETLARQSPGSGLDKFFQRCLQRYSNSQSPDPARPAC